MFRYIIRGGNNVKKIFMLISIITIMLCSSCYFFSKDKIKVVSINFYDQNDEEIKGEYKNYYEELYNYNDQLSNFLCSEQQNSTKLNSSAPILNFYYAKLDKGSYVKVKFQFKGIEMTKVTLKDPDFNLTEVVEFSVDDEYSYATYIVSSLEDVTVLELYSYLDSEQNIRYFSEQGGRVYIKGIYIDVN